MLHRAQTPVLWMNVDGIMSQRAIDHSFNFSGIQKIHPLRLFHTVPHVAWQEERDDGEHEGGSRVRSAPRLHPSSHSSSAGLRCHRSCLQSIGEPVSLEQADRSVERPMFASAHLRCDAAGGPGHVPEMHTLLSRTRWFVFAGRAGSTAAGRAGVGPGPDFDPKPKVF